MKVNFHGHIIDTEKSRINLNEYGKNSETILATPLMADAIVTLKNGTIITGTCNGKNYAGFQYVQPRNSFHGIKIAVAEIATIKYEWVK